MEFLIVGLGNPGKGYEKTRHNIGQRIVESFAKGYGMKFKQNEKFQGLFARGEIEKKTVNLLLPTTYMNLSGIATRLCQEYYKIELSHLLVVVDDVEIPFGEFRLKKEGSSGGHNGLKSIEEHLHTQNYYRLRVGLSRQGESLADYVLENFSSSEEKELEQLIPQAEKSIKLWLEEGEKAMNVANVRHKKIKQEEK